MSAAKKVIGVVCSNCGKNVATRIEHEADGTPHPLCDTCPPIEAKG